MKRSYSPNYGEPKYKSQSLVFDRLKVVFDDAIKEREELLSNQKNNENKNFSNVFNFFLQCKH